MINVTKCPLLNTKEHETEEMLYKLLDVVETWHNSNMFGSGHPVF